MKELLLKEFRGNKLQEIGVLCTLFLTSIVFIFIWISEKGRPDPGLVFYTIILIISIGFISMFFLIVDELSNFTQVIVSLPVTRNKVVMSKYLSASIQIAFATLVHFIGSQVGSFLSNGFNYPHLAILNHPVFWVSIMVFVVLFNCCILPFYFKYGLAKGAFLCFGSLFFIFAIGVLSYKIFGDAETLIRSIKIFLNQNKWLLILELIGFLSISIITSIFLSKKYFKTRDL